MKGGAKYRGEYLENRAHGRGVLMASTGTVIFDGDFKNGDVVLK